MPPGGGLEFDSEPAAPTSDASFGPRGLTGLVVKWGLAKDERSASYVLLGTAAAAVVIAVGVLVFFGSSGTANIPHPSDAEMRALGQPQ